MIWNFCIGRPVFTVVIFVVIAIFGVFGYRQMPLREYPNVEFPIVNVNVVLPGAEPSVIETEIVEPLEEQINTIEGLRELTSTARDQVASITAEFELWRDIDVATQDVRDRVDRALRELPNDIEAPLVNKIDPDAQALMWIALTGNERWDGVKLSGYADNVLKEQLENLRGVGQIHMAGERKYAVRIRIDADKLAAHHLTVGDVIATIQSNNVDIPSGRIQSKRREFRVKTQGQFAAPGPINDLIITTRNGAPVRISDVGHAVADIENDRQTARLDGKNAVGLGIVKQSDANTVALAETTRERVAELAKDFPPGLEYTVTSDSSLYTKSVIRDLMTTIILATALVSIVVWVFLRSGGGTFIAIMAIPTSLLGGIALIHALGFSLNTLTMLGLILVIGIVVDDTIVILENCFQKLEGGAEPIPAAQVGTTEVAFAAIANTFSLAAVFIPVAFTGGLIGRFFFEFGLTVALTVFMSTFTALTLTPMLSSRFLRPPNRGSRAYRVFEAVFIALERAYLWLLDRAFNHRSLTVLLALAALGASIYLFANLSREFIPSADQSQLTVTFETPEGSTLEATDDFGRAIERELDRVEGIESYFQTIGLADGGAPGKVNNGVVFVKLEPRTQRDRPQKVIAQDVRERLEALPGGRAFVIEPSIGPGAGGHPIQVVLKSAEITTLTRQKEDFMDWMREQPEFVGITSNFNINTPQVELTIHRDKASEMGISVADVSNCLRLLLGEPNISEIEQAGKRYDVIPEILQKGEMVPLDLQNLYVRNAGGELVSLGNLLELRETVGPDAIHHFDGLRAATLSASNPPGVALGDAIAKLEDYFATEVLPGVNYSLVGEGREFKESFGYLTLALVFSVVFIFLVLSAQFESFIHPLTILLSLPLASVGAFGALYITGMAFNIVSFIGLIMLMGMATKNAILLIDYTNVLRARGLPIVEAAKKAVALRFRPVMMTTVSTVVGMLPIALGFGAGGESRAPLGVAVAAGLAVTTLLTLIIIPVMYTLLDTLHHSIQRHARRTHYTGRDSA